MQENIGMSLIEHNVNNMYNSMLSQQNTTMIKNSLYDLNNRTNSLLQYNNQQVIQTIDNNNQSDRSNRLLFGMVIEHQDHGEIVYKANSTSSFLTQYFTFMSYWIGNIYRFKCVFFLF